MINNFGHVHSPIFRWLLEFVLTLRALLFIGTKFTCPCCGWKLRTFTHGKGSFRARHHGYCPRCNAKARHRRDWLFLEQKTNLFADRLSMLHVAPIYGLSRRFIKMPNLRYFGVNLGDYPNICTMMDLSSTPFCSNIFDAAICIHVLEHIQEDRKAIAELYRVLKPGGWALITVPIRLNQKTFEDPTINTPEERKQAFGETGHFRMYGYDLINRLEEGGFRVQMEPGKDIDKRERDKYGLLDDENIFFCTKKPNALAETE